MSRRVDVPSAETMIEARRELLAQLNPSGSAGARFFDVQSARRMEDALVRVGVNVEGGNWGVDLTGSFDSSLETSTVIAKFTQVFYATVFEPLGSPEPEFFAPNVTLDMVKERTGPGNPPCYISQIQYGRMLVLVVTGETSHRELGAALRGWYRSGVKGEAKAEAKHKELLESLGVQAWDVGQAGEEGAKAIFGEAKPGLEGVRKWILDGLQFDFERNPGDPILYTVRYIGDATLAEVQLTSEFQETERVEAPNESKQVVMTRGAPDSQLVYPTGIEVGVGDTVNIKAQGTLDHKRIADQPWGPEGWTGPAGDNFLLPGAPEFSVIAGVGNSKKPPGSPSARPEASPGWWHVATQPTTPITDAHFGGPTASPKRGSLPVAINDDVPRAGTGSFTADVTVERKFVKRGGRPAPSRRRRKRRRRSRLRPRSQRSRLWTGSVLCWVSTPPRGSGRSGACEGCPRASEGRHLTTAGRRTASSISRGHS